MRVVAQLLFHLAIAHVVVAQQPGCTCNGTLSPQTAAPITPAPVQSLIAPVSSDVAVLTVGIALLLALLAISFYYTVIWPKRAFLEYRRRFEELVKQDLIAQDMKLLKIGKGSSPVYGGAAEPNGDRKQRRIPTMREIEAALAASAAASESVPLTAMQDSGVRL